MAAALGRNPAVAKLVLQAGADVEASDDQGATAMAYAVSNGFLDVGQLLLDAGAKSGRDRLMAAAAGRGHIPLLRSLLAGGVGVNTRAPGGRTALHAAASEGQAATVRFLLTVGADVAARDVDARTPLMDAAAAGDVEALTELLRKGADREAVDNDGRTAWNHAMRNRQTEAAKLLETSDHGR
jgi:ankyrin repeat protein